MKNSDSQSISAFIQTRLEAFTEKDVTLKQLVNQFGQRSVDLALVLFGLLAMLPISFIPGFSTILAVIIILLVWQLLSREPTLWLPKAVATRQIPIAKIRQAVVKVLPKIAAVEKLIKPRLLLFSGRLGQWVVGIVIVFQAVLLMLPIPFSNFFYGLFIVCLALGLLEKDGLLVLIGIGLACIYNVSVFFIFWVAISKLLIGWM